MSRTSYVHTSSRTTTSATTKLRRTYLSRCQEEYQLGSKLVRSSGRNMVMGIRVCRLYHESYGTSIPELAHPIRGIIRADTRCQHHASFVFWELCYIRNYQAGSKNFPSESNEIPVRVVGFSESVGHSITYKVYNEATGALLYRSHLRKIDHGADINSRVSPSQFLIAAPVFSVRRPSRPLFSDSSPIVCQPQRNQRIVEERREYFMPLVFFLSSFLNRF